MNNLENDIPKHQKKKESSTSKAKTKSNHKHEYIDCLLIQSEHKLPLLGSCCKICGKIGDAKFDTVLEDGYYRMLTSDEVYKKYQDLEKIYIDDIFQKYISKEEV